MVMIRKSLPQALALTNGMEAMRKLECSKALNSVPGRTQRQGRPSPSKAKCKPSCRWSLPTSFTALRSIDRALCLFRDRDGEQLGQVRTMLVRSHPNRVSLERNDDVRMLGRI